MDPAHLVLDERRTPPGCGFLFGQFFGLDQDARLDLLVRDPGEAPSLFFEIEEQCWLHPLLWPSPSKMVP
ncbi:hypothetical protein NLM33_38765 [Bradyrhizobium sp. CCGUVB1N3]|uniref:hypothetical protein n=1 Tax=Bradyrhizobium sp. CCGUVB1N3 TaxID=2949629 RepID=UPI0020B38190|nr:hypothetical protein [Bradyrhizobium sp. CCGUVB1N3]MCP3476163.1 hypothetical protein [Bradyrhizobium sp. CCGUVB1N3]